jgi:hypothetical protein
MRSTWRTIYAALAWLFVAGLVVQVFLAGRGVFESPVEFETHRTWGFLLELFPIVLLIVGLVAGVGRRLAVFAIVAFVLFILQSVFVALRESSPIVAALHPVNGFLILLIAIEMAREAWQGRTTTA